MASWQNFKLLNWVVIEAAKISEKYLKIVDIFLPKIRIYWKKVSKLQFYEFFKFYLDIYA